MNETTGTLTTTTGSRPVIIMGATRTDSTGTYVLVRFPDRAWKYGVWERADKVTAD
jgi:hypothetical protein